jgi:hypothetical protein
VSTQEERDQERAEINAALPEGAELLFYGNGTPWQADGLFNGLEMYARFRHNQASMTVWHGLAWKSDVVLSSVIYPWYPEDSEEALGGHAGDLNGYDEIVPLMRRLLEELAPNSEDNPTSAQLLAREVEALTKAIDEGRITVTIEGKEAQHED